MKANTKLINALRKVANDIEAGNVIYSWRQPDSCNCGLLAREFDAGRWHGETSKLPPWWNVVMDCPH